MCLFINDVPHAYHGPIDDMGRRTDASTRPELSQGSVEFVAPVEYMVRPPQPPVYMFVIDVSYPAVTSGVVHTVCAAIKQALPTLPGGERTQIGFVTYNSSVHFYNLRPTLSAPAMLVVPDISDIFLPVPDDLLVNLSESRALVDQLLDSLPKVSAAAHPAAADGRLCCCLQLCRCTRTQRMWKRVWAQRWTPRSISCSTSEGKWSCVKHPSRRLARES